MVARKLTKHKSLRLRITKKAKPGVITKKRKKTALDLVRHHKNPLMSPVAGDTWESAAVFNPGAILLDNKVHLFYRALGADGVSRIGYAVSKDGVHFEREPFPVFMVDSANMTTQHSPYSSPARFVYDRERYPSGGGWGGCEDPRTVNIEGTIYMTFNMFNGWDSMRVAYSTITKNCVERKDWDWSPLTYLTRPGDRQKNWILFPEKIHGKFAIIHNIDLGDPSRIHIAYLNKLDMHKTPSQKEAPDIHTLPDHIVAWHHRTRSVSAPPIKTPEGWLLFYHAMDKDDPGRYKVGVMLLDLKQPNKIICRSTQPVLEPDEWYENDWKPGIVYANGAVVKDGHLFVYYGGGDKHIAVASANLGKFLTELKHKKHVVLTKRPAIKV